MKHFFTLVINKPSNYARRGAFLLAICGLGPAAWGQSFGPVSTYSTGANSNPYGLAVGDVNGDSRPDIVSANSNSHTVGVLLGQTSGGFVAATTYSTGPNSTPTNVALGDVNGDGQFDIVTANEGNQTAGVLLGQAGGFAAVSNYSTGTGSFPRGVALADANGDGRLDIFVTDTQNNTIAVLLGQTGGFAPVASYAVGMGSNPRDVTVGDLNGDGRADIVTANVASASVGVLLGLASGGFATVSTYSTGTNSRPTSVTLGDVNGDGRPDIVTAVLNVSSPDNVGVLLGQAGGGFAPVSLSAIGTSVSPLGVALGDVNGDGRLDVLTANFSTNNVGVLLGTANGLAPMILYAMGSGSMPARVVLADVNGDRRLDIVTANQGLSEVGVLLNTGTFTPLFTTRPTAAEVSVAPNPSRGRFMVQVPTTFGVVQAELLNALGQVVRRPAATGTRFSVETSGLAAGVYALRLHTGGAAVTKRVVLE